jgi:hypothetical protein
MCPIKCDCGKFHEWRHVHNTRELLSMRKRIRRERELGRVYRAADETRGRVSRKVPTPTPTPTPSYGFGMFGRMYHAVRGVLGGGR